MSSDQGIKSSVKPDNIGILSIEEALQHRGIDLLLKMKEGGILIPPFIHTMGVEFDEISDGFSAFSMVPSYDYYNGLGCLHGGIISALIDTAMACSIQSKLSKGQTYTTLEFKINFVRAVYVDTGPIRAEGRLLHFGRTTASAEGKLYDQRGKLYAFGTTTCTIIRPGSENLSH